ncbi:MAG TPA: hypothetical protein VE645_16325, partial [Pseudonocardiaceae bacterium]|nr:hypothetical protein [Pseudonocardiaceae bacterium]
PRHHTLKHQGGWTLTQPQAGHFIWNSPLGQTYRTRGEPITPDLPQPLPRDADPDPDPPGVPMTFEGPILDLPERPHHHRDHHPPDCLTNHRSDHST